MGSARLLIAFAVTGALARTALAQSRSAVLAERAEYITWQRENPLSPRRAVVVRPIGAGLSLGPTSADIPLSGVSEGRLEEKDGRVSLVGTGPARVLPRGRTVSLGEWKLVVSGRPGRATVTVFRPDSGSGKPPAWYPFQGAAVYPVTLVPPSTSGTRVVLGPDGVEVDASEAGTVAVPFPGGARTLHVLRLPGATEEESELEIYFRDGSSGRGTYPAGRFVSLIPRGGDKYLLDFNRARNPWCAYNTVYPCPAPWSGNMIPEAIRAGEQYAGGGLDAPKPY